MNSNISRGIKRSDNRTDLVIKMFVQMYINENMTAEEIAEETGYNIRTVKKRLSEAGIYKSELKKH